MRDGVILRADIYRPKADGKFPVLLERTPYDKDNEADRLRAARGFVVIIEDIRGRYASEGEWYTFKNEPNDGYDTIEWAAALPYSNGKVGMFGGSYVGATQMLAAIAHPPHLAGICPIVTASNYHETGPIRAARSSNGSTRVWTSGLAQDTLDAGRRQHQRAAGNVGASARRLSAVQHDKHLMPTSSATLAPYYLDWLAHPNYDDYWKAISIEEHFADINVPALAHRRLVRHFSRRIAAQLSRHQGHGASEPRATAST